MLWTLAALAAETPENDAAEEVIVYSDLRRRTDRETPVSTTVVTQETIARRNATHLEEVLNTAPNLNFSMGSSRARFFQIRGIGERSQFAEPLNPSVGLVIDGIDMTGLGTVAGLADARQVEILRGPQGTLYGANALAGLIRITTNDPSDTFEAEGTVGAANYDTLDVRAVASVPLSPTVGVRVAASHLQSDGFYTNDYLKRDNTMGRDELTVRGKLVWEASPRLAARLTAFHARAQNGYDAFSFDNDRTTIADQPGHDDQITTGMGAEAAWTTPAATLEARTSLAISDVGYGYDEDWTYEGYHPDGYSSFDDYQRGVSTASSEVRLVSGEDGSLFGGHTDWVVGAYTWDRTVDLVRTQTYAERDFESTNRIQRRALYGETTTKLDSPLSFTLGLRGEHHRITYSDNDGVSGNPGEWLWGGRLAASYGFGGASAYGLVSRGYRSGGFNASPDLPDANRQYTTESLWNFEVGTKGAWLNGRSTAKVAVFYQARENVQANGSLLIRREDGSTQFVDYTENADHGHNAGVELEGDVQILRPLKAYGSLGLLNTRLRSTIPDAPYDGREQAMAPRYMGVAGVRADIDVVYGGVEVEAKDRFYFSTRHDTQSTAYALLNAHLGVRVDPSLEVMLWARNLNDAKVYTRGFGSFGNDPANGWEVQDYLQLGDPRVFGVRLTGRL
ncbi:MAG: TonB-dependent receptor [Alphaproteobacteria bacterium]|nr:TonB-dependent receptor [Alphaproteobacteria bacterium]